MIKVKQYVIACVASILLFVSTYVMANDVVTTLATNRSLIFKALTEQKLLNKYRQLVHLTHVCNLIIDAKAYAVINVHEHIKTAQVARGVSHLFVMDDSLKVTKKIFYDGSATPLYCSNNQLFLYGLIDIDGLEPEGNVITFSDRGQKAVVSERDALEFPAQTLPQ